MTFPPHTTSSSTDGTFELSFHFVGEMDEIQDECWASCKWRFNLCTKDEGAMRMKVKINKENRENMITSVLFLYKCKKLESKIPNLFHPQ